MTAESSARSSARSSAVFDAVLASIVGAAELDRGAVGVTPARLPRWARDQVPDIVFPFVAGVPAGVRIEAVTDAPWIEIDAQLTVLESAKGERTTATFDAVVDGEVVASVAATDTSVLVMDPAAFRMTPGGPATVRIGGLPGRPGTRVEIWLPHAAAVELIDARIPEGCTLAPALQQGPVWIHYGSSISHCAGSPRPTDMWPAIAARAAGVALVDLGLAGECHLDQCVARYIRDQPADAISLKCGINVLNGDTMRERVLAPALHGFLDTVRDGHPDTPLLVVTPIAFPAGEDAPGPSVVGADGMVRVVPRSAELATGALSLRRIREVVTAVVAGRRAAGDANLHLLSGLDFFGPGVEGVDLEVDLPDGLHPSPDATRAMGTRFHRLAFGRGGPFEGIGSGTAAG